ANAYGAKVIRRFRRAGGDGGATFFGPSGGRVDGSTACIAYSLACCGGAVVPPGLSPAAPPPLPDRLSGERLGDLLVGLGGRRVDRRVQRILAGQDVDQHLLQD